MTIGAYLVGVLLLVLIVGPLALAAHAVRTRFLPDWNGSLGAVTVVIGVAAALVAIAQALGSVGAFAPVPLSLTCAGVGGGLWAWVRRRPRPDAPTRVRSEHPRVELAVAGSITASVAAMWSTWVSQSYAYGIENRDSVWYHLPIAARFVQEGSVSGLHFLNGEALVTYYPANASLLHAVGMVAFGRDDLSLLLNLAAVPLCLVTAWAIGRRWDAAPVALAGVATVLALPLLASTQAGTAKDDILSLAFLLAAVAFLIHADGRSAAFGLAGLAVGLALGTKLTMLVPALVLGGAVIVVGARARRWRPVLAFVAGTLLTGSYWYVRNAVATGNPVPSTDLLGLPSPSTPSIDRFGPAAIEYLDRGDAWSKVFHPGLGDAFGTAWPLLLTLTVVGIVVALGRGPWAVRAAGLAAAGSAVAFLFLPGTAFGVGVLGSNEVAGTARLIFAYNLRYLVGALALGLLFLSLARGAWRLAALGAMAVTVFINVVDAGGLRGWAPGYTSTAVFAMLSTLAVFWALARPTAPWPRIAAVVGLLALLVGFPASLRYHDRRYDRNPLAALADRVDEEADIAIAGFAAHYPLYDDDLGRRVQYLGVEDDDGGFRSFDDCRAWRQALHGGDYEYVVTPTRVVTPLLGFDLARWRLGDPTGEPPLEPLESVWNREDPGLREIAEDRGATLYEVGDEVSADGCEP